MINSAHWINRSKNSKGNLDKLHLRFCPNAGKSSWRCDETGVPVDTSFSGYKFQVDTSLATTKLGKASWRLNLDICISFAHSFWFWTLPAWAECRRQMPKCSSVSQCRQRNPKCPNECVARAAACCNLHSLLGRQIHKHKYRSYKHKTLKYWCKHTHICTSP